MTLITVYQTFNVIRYMHLEVEELVAGVTPSMGGN